MADPFGRPVEGARRGPGDTPGGWGAEAVRVRLLGGFGVRVGPRMVQDAEWRLKKAKALVKLLSLAYGHRLRRERTIEELWPELGPQAAANNLRGAIYAARRALLGPGLSAGGAPSRYLLLEGEEVVLCPRSPLWVDVEAFEEAAAVARQSTEPAALRAAVELYTGELLPEDRYEGWAEGRREALRETYLELLWELARLHEGRGELDLAIEVLGRLVEAEPLREGAHASLMRLYALCGRRGEALVQYGRLSGALRRELGVEPSPQSQRLHEQIRSGRLARPGRQPRIDRGRNQQEEALSTHNLPTSRTSFVGRGRELAGVKRALSMTGLLTLTGAGGSGKTRLALEAARQMEGLYPDGVRLVRLAPLREPALVPEAVAAALGVREQPGRSSTEALIGFLGAKRLLVLLDNCEHLIDAAARLVGTLLESCPNLRVLATSREPLRLPEEVSWPVPPLSVPDPGSSPPAGDAEPENPERYESVRLFVERARARLPAFGLTQHNAWAVAEVCRKLDGIPLAIELAAARLPLLAVEQVAEKLNDSLGLLGTGARTADPRQRTMWATLAWSYDLLGEEEQKTFGRLSVFAGGFSLEAAEAVVAGEGVGEGGVLDLLSGLVDKSLIVAETGAGEGGGGVARYRMLEPARQYARERLEESGEAAVVRHRHALWCVALVGRDPAAFGELQEEEEQEWRRLGRLELEHDNLREALTWTLARALDGGEEEQLLGLKLAGGLWSFWYTRGYLREGRAWIERALTASTADDPATSPARALALYGAGYIALFQGEYAEAKELLERSLTLYRRLGDEEGIASCLHSLGFVAVLGERDLETIPTLLEELMALRPRLKNKHTIANALILAGLVAGSQGDWQRAVALHEESLALFRQTADTQGVCMCLTNLGLIALVREDLAGATALLRENLRLAGETQDKVAIQYSLFGLAGVAAKSGRPARAVWLWAASEAVREAAGIRLTSLARSATEYERLMDEVRATLGEEAFEEAWADGRAATQQSAVEYAFSKEQPDPAPKDAPEELEETRPVGWPPPATLTRREEEVAALVARGLANKQIAAELGVSTRTVESHIGRILKKLGLRSGRELATRLREKPPRGTRGE